MPGRIDYHDDPDAPKPNSMVPSVNVVVANSAGEILLTSMDTDGVQTGFDHVAAIVGALTKDAAWRGHWREQFYRFQPD